MEPASGFALSRQSAASARMVLLRSLCAIAEGVRAGAGVGASRDTSLPGCCVPAVLHDAQRRLCVMGGRAGMPRSLGSVYAGSVVRFLGGFAGVQRRLISLTPDAGSTDVAVSRDGSTLLISCADTHSVHVVDAASGTLIRTLGGCAGDGPLQFTRPNFVCVSVDDFVFVSESVNNRVQVLTPQLDFYGFIGVGTLGNPQGVCADTDVVAVADADACQVLVFCRRSYGLLYRFGSRGGRPGQLAMPMGLCFLGKSRRIAVADWGNDRISVFSFKGYFIYHVGAGVLDNPKTVACSAFNELIVADRCGLFVFGANSEVLHTMRGVEFTGVKVHGDSVFAVKGCGECVVFA
jgi:hypothetical protein